MLKLTNGKYKRLGKEKEYAIWAVLNGDTEGTKEQKAFVAQVENVWLDWTAEDCPASYQKARSHLHVFASKSDGQYARAMGVRR